MDISRRQFFKLTSAVVASSLVSSPLTDNSSVINYFSPVPDGDTWDWIVTEGQELSRDKYSELFECIGTRFGKGDGVTTFNIPSFKSALELINEDSPKPLDYFIKARNNEKQAAPIGTVMLGNVMVGNA